MKSFNCAQLAIDSIGKNNEEMEIEEQKLAL